MAEQLTGIVATDRVDNFSGYGLVDTGVPIGQFSWYLVGYTIRGPYASLSSRGCVLHADNGLVLRLIL